MWEVIHAFTRQHRQSVSGGTPALSTTLEPKQVQTSQTAMTAVADRLCALADEARSWSDLADVMSDVTHELGSVHFALTHHVHYPTFRGSAIRIHNYPVEWAERYDRVALGPRDPVHRASHTTALGFSWCQIPRMIALTRQDRDILANAAMAGISDGFTVPAHVPGEISGSCTFVFNSGGSLPTAIRQLAQLAGTFAFEAARRLCLPRGILAGTRRVPLTDRQRDCALWVARGKSDWEISQILGISPETTACHLSDACRRYGVHKRTLLVALALFDGTLTFNELLSSGYPPFPG